MATALGTLLAAWSSLEPSASLMVYASAILFGSISFIRLQNTENAYRSFTSILVTASISSFLFMGITGMSYVLLASSHKEYSPILEALAAGEEYKKDVQMAQKKWGGAIVQEGLSVIHTFDRVDILEMKAADGEKRYINQTITETVVQETISGFTGVVDLHLVDPYLNTYEANVDYRYTIKNQSDLNTTAHFFYPISRSRTYRNFLVTVNGVDVGSSLSLNIGDIIWEVEMAPHQTVDVTVSYQVKGMGGYIHTIVNKDAVRNYSFTINTDSRDLFVSTKPDTAAIKYVGESTELGYHLSWTIEQSILAPQTGIRFKPSVSPDPSYRHVIQMTRFAPRSVMFLLVVFIFTMMICSIKVDIWRLLILAVTFSMQFLALMGLGMAGITGWHVLPILFVATFLLTYLAVRDLPSLPLNLTLFAVFLFAFAYPYAGLLPNGPERTAFDAVVQALVIFYVFGLSLYIRISGMLTESRGI